MTHRFILAALVFCALQPVAARASSPESARLSLETSFAASLNGAFRALERKDLLTDIGPCGVVDQKGLGVYTFEEAVEALAPCARALSLRLQSRVSIDGGSDETVRILELRFPARVTLAHKDLRDLHYSLERRGGKLLGFPARLVRERAEPSSSSAAFRPNAKSKSRSRERAMPRERDGDSRDDGVDPDDLDDLGNPRRRTSPGPDDVDDEPSRGGGDDYIGGFPLF